MSLGSIAYAITQNDCIGYSQPERQTIYSLSGPSDTSHYVNVDCSEMICAIFEWYGDPVFTRDVWTGSLRQQAAESGKFDIWEWDEDYVPTDGDILLTDGHVCMIGMGLICEAWIAEDGSIDGYAGDSTGNEVHAWNYWGHPYTQTGKWVWVIRYRNGDNYNYENGDELEMASSNELLEEIASLLRSGKEGEHYAGDINWYLKAIWEEAKATHALVEEIADRLRPGEAGKRYAGTVIGYLAALLTQKNNENK